MTALAVAARPGIGWRPSTGTLSAAFLLCAAFLIRLPSFGDPTIDVDEQFYLLAGDRLLHGALPYVDVWDRKPIGLFLLYAAIRSLGGEGIVQYQVIATLFATTTAWLIARIAGRAAAPIPATAAGLGYLLWIETVGGGGGQSPVFYNALVAAAAWLVLPVIEERDPHRIWSRGLAAMALVGLALQIKYTALFEGAFLGLILAARLWMVAGLRATIPRCLYLALIAFAPTAAALTFYIVIGHGQVFLFANFTSIALRAPVAAATLHARLVTEAGHLVPVLLCAIASCWHVRRTGDGPARRWLIAMIGWTTAAAIGFASVGVFFFHYLLPLYVPLCILAAPILGRRMIGPAFGLILLGFPAINLDYPDIATTARHRETMARLVSHLPANVDRECLYIHDGPPSLFLLGRACALSPYLFPHHLSLAIEARAVGVDTAAEVGRILARQPAAITLSMTRLPVHNQASFDLVQRAVRRDYRLVAREPDDGGVIGLYVRR